MSAEEKRRHRQAYKTRHREKHLAVTAVGKAVKEGVLVRPDVCERCGEAGPVQAHHADYERRLDVGWLCVACHSGEHTANRVRVDMRLPEDLLQAVDAARGDASRTRFVERAVRAALAVSERPVPVHPNAAIKQTESHATKRPVKVGARADVNDAYQRMMAERQARMNQGKA